MNAIIVANLINIVAIIFLIWEAVYAINQPASRIQNYLIVAIFSLIIMFVGYEVEITASTEALAMAGNAFGFIGKPFALLSSTLFIVTYCGYSLPKWLHFPLALVNAIFPALVFTNEYHHLYYETVYFDSNAVFSGLQLGYGPWCFVYMGFVLAYIIFDIVFIVIAFKRSSSKREFVHVIYFCIIIFSAIAGYLLHLSGLTGGYDTTLIGCTIGAICMYRMFTKFKIFNVIALAKEQAVDDANIGILVINLEGKIVYQNKFVKKLLRASFTVAELLKFDNGARVVHKSSKVYSVTRNHVKKDMVLLGETVEILDVTDSYNYSQKLEAEVEERINELRHVQRRVVAGFSDMVEARDGNTGDHIKNTVKYVRMICEGLLEKNYFAEYFTQKFADYIIDAAPMHDIGKIAISDTILLKPAKLTDEEFEIMKTHAAAGKDIVENTMRGIEDDAYIEVAKQVAGSHHEKWDGSGYPEGLKGEAIPIAARIMAVADVYDALVSERVYKPPFSEEDALEIIKRGSGSHFDPTIAAVFVDKFKKEKYRNAIKDMLT